jgi:hypothetical protein
MLSSFRAVDPLLPGFQARSKLAIARDVAIILLCAALLVAFLAEVWSGSAAKRPAESAPARPPAASAMLAPASAL